MRFRVDVGIQKPPLLLKPGEPPIMINHMTVEFDPEPGSFAHHWPVEAAKNIALAGARERFPTEPLAVVSVWHLPDAPKSESNGVIEKILKGEGE